MPLNAFFANARIWQPRIRLASANTDRINASAEILRRFRDVNAGIQPTLFIHRRYAKLLERLPPLQHDPNRPEDVLKRRPNEEGVGCDDSADALRYFGGDEGAGGGGEKIGGGATKRFRIDGVTKS